LLQAMRARADELGVGVRLGYLGSKGEVIGDVRGLTWPRSPHPRRHRLAFELGGEVPVEFDAIEAGFDGLDHGAEQFEIGQHKLCDVVLADAHGRPPYHLKRRSKRSSSPVACRISRMLWASRSSRSRTSLGDADPTKISVSF